MWPVPGEDFDLGRWVVDGGEMRQYLEAVGDSSSIYQELDVVPPMALAARALGALVSKLALPSGTIHASQELSCHRTVRTLEEVSCTARLSRPMTRAGRTLVAVEFTLHDSLGEPVMSGKSTVLVPEAGD